MNLKKIIAFSGSHGTGKTSQAYSTCGDLRKIGKNVIVLDELARLCPFKINQDAEPRTQPWLITKQISTELELLDKFEYIITDRTVMDAYAYAKVLGDTRANNYLPAIIDHIKNHCYKIYLMEPISYNYQVDDGVRDMDPEFRMRVFEELLHAYNKAGIEYKLIFSIFDLQSDLFKV